MLVYKLEKCQRERGSNVVLSLNLLHSRKRIENTSHSHTLPASRFITEKVARYSTSFSFWSLVPSVAPAGVHPVVWRSVPAGCCVTRRSVTRCSVPHVSAGTRCRTRRLPSLAMSGRFIPTCCCWSRLSTEYQILNNEAYASV